MTGLSFVKNCVSPVSVPLITKSFSEKCFGEENFGENFQYFRQIFRRNLQFLKMNLIDSKAKVNLQYKISARKGKATDWINKSSETTLK